MRKTCCLIVTLILTISCAPLFSVRPSKFDVTIYEVGEIYHDELLDDYGPGIAYIRERINHVATYPEQQVIWNDAYKEAFIKLIELRALSPAVCVNGIVMLGVGVNENFAAHGTFRCK